MIYRSTGTLRSTKLLSGHAHVHRERQGLDEFQPTFVSTLRRRSWYGWSNKVGSMVEKSIIRGKTPSTDMPWLEQRRLRGDLIETHKLSTQRKCSRSNFFSQRIVKFWNNLPKYIAQAPTLGTFKSDLNHGKWWHGTKSRRNVFLLPINQPSKAMWQSIEPYTSQMMSWVGFEPGIVFVHFRHR